MTNKLAVAALSLAALAALAMAVALGAEDERAWHEPLPAKTLTGTDVALLPHSFAGAHLVVGFSRASNEQTRAWGERLEASGEAPVYRVVVLAGAPGFVRRMVARGIRGSFPEAKHEFFYLVDEKADAWRELVGFDNEDAAYVLRLDGDGRVCARHQGEVTDAALAKLAAGCG